MSATLLCTLNSRIGWSEAYVGHGVGPVLGLLVVCVLIFVGIVAVAVGKEEGCHGSQFAGIGFWLVAGLLLQGLPHVATGIQFVPLLPWCYSAWIPRIVSAASWLTFLIGILAGTKERWKEASAAVLIAFGLNALLSFADMAHTTAPIESSSVIASCRDKIAQCDKLRSQRAAALERLLSEKETLVGRIKAVGAKSKKELMAQPLGRTLVAELEQLSRQIGQLRSEIDAIDSVVERGQSSLRCLEREALVHEAKSTDEEYKQLCDADHTLVEELRRVAGDKTPGSDVNLDKLLNEIILKDQ